MDYAGTLQISHHGTGRVGDRVYLITFISARSDEATSGGRRCKGDLALVKMLEGLVPDADVRRCVLEQLHDKGRASARQIVLSDEQAAPFGLGRRRRAGMFSAAVRVPEGEAHCLGRDLAEEVATVLREAKGRPFCHTCFGGPRRHRV
jgi:hypothetical protein